MAARLTDRHSYIEIVSNVLADREMCGQNKKYIYSVNPMNPRGGTGGYSCAMKTPFKGMLSS